LPGPMRPRVRIALSAATRGCHRIRAMIKSRSRRRRSNAR
jgi:hypothetical protein